MTTSPSAETRKDAAATLKAASSAVDPGKFGIGQKVAIVGTVLRLSRRYPLAALIVAGVAVALYIGRGRDRIPVARH